MILNSMIADICDLDELKSGHRREAFYGAVFVTTDKIAMAVSLALQGFLLVASGFDSKLDVQPAGTIHFWLLALVITQPVGFLIGMLSIFIYPLSRGRLQEIRARTQRPQTAECNCRHVRHRPHDHKRTGMKLTRPLNCRSFSETRLLGIHVPPVWLRESGGNCNL